MAWLKVFFVMFLFSPAFAQTTSDIHTYWNGRDIQTIQSSLTIDCEDPQDGFYCTMEASQFSEGRMGDLPARIVKLHYQRDAISNREGNIYVLISYERINDDDYTNPHFARTSVSQGGDFRYVYCYNNEPNCSSKPGVVGPGFLGLAKRWGYTGALPSEK